MINLILSLLCGAAGWALSLLVFDSFWTGIIPFFIFTIIALVVFNRRTSKKLKPIMDNVQQMAMSVQTLPTMQARKNVLDKAVEELKKGYALQHYQFFLRQQINGQIGSIYYAQQKFKEAEPYLKDSFIQNWQTSALYACILYRNNKIDDMKIQFEKILKVAKKEAIVWNLYAWCLNEKKERDAAIEVLVRGKKNCPNDSIIKSNLDLIKNSGKVKMRDYKEMWMQFLLDDSITMQAGGHLPNGGRQLDAFQKELLDRYSRVHGR